mmetsp:Transcript_1874/g.3537  ORF Transcript_1874/g.3537 Transcript_1874/m.3537 type:complete len:146 (-) Transcript_1874:325-762(-)
MTLSAVIGPGDLVTRQKQSFPVENLHRKIVLLYFSAHWCPPCRAFTPKLVKFYEDLKAQGVDFDIIFVSSDRDQASFEEYFAFMPWLAIPMGDKRARNLMSKFGVQGIPSLIVLDGTTGDLISKNGRTEVDSKGVAAYPLWVRTT